MQDLERPVEPVIPLFMSVWAFSYLHPNTSTVSKTLLLITTFRFTCFVHKNVAMSGTSGAALQNTYAQVFTIQTEVSSFSNCTYIAVCTS